MIWQHCTKQVRRTESESFRLLSRMLPKPDESALMAKDNRLYARFTLDFPDHPKIAILSDSAFRTLVDATIYSRRLLTDGFLARRLAVAKWSLQDLQELCANDPNKPSLIECEDGWYIHDYDQQQDTRAEVEKRRRDAKNAGQVGGRASAKKRATQRVQSASSGPSSGPSSSGSSGPSSSGSSGPSSGFQAETETETETETTCGPSRTVGPVGIADDVSSLDNDDTYELATRERGLSEPINIGASRLVDTVIPRDSIPSAHRTALRLKASELINKDHETEDDVAECLRIWLTKPELGPNALKSCMSEVYKRRNNGPKMSTRDRQFMELQAMKNDDGSEWKTPRQLAEDLFKRRELPGAAR